MSVSLYADGKSIVEVHNKFYDSVFEKKNAEFYKKTSFTDFYQLIFNNNFYEIKLWNFNIDSVVIYRELKFYKSVKFIYSNESYDISEAYVCDTLNLCKKANISGNEYNWIIDIRDVKK